VVIGAGFAWAHLPKTGGDATLAMFRLFPDLIEYADPDDTNDKHAFFHSRATQIRGRVLAMNIRRLPTWVLSRAQHVSRRGLYPEYRPLPMSTPEELADSSFPDERLLAYTSDGRFQPDRWLRMESLAQDFLDFVSDFHPVDDADRRRVEQLGPVNMAEYDHRIANWFTPAQIERLYLNNPTWATIEEELYGGPLELQRVTAGDARENA
jgi:hypothetical protein